MARLEIAHHVADTGIERRFPRAGKGDEIEMRFLAEHFVEFGDHPVDRDVLFAFEGVERGASGFAVDTVFRTGFGLHQIDAERNAQPPRGDRAEHILFDHKSLNFLTLYTDGGSSDFSSSRSSSSAGVRYFFF